ncbi:hypothetical protein DFH09DRAFT_1364923 [Mycena vulgaris]|nr:hypothetical protein DFH09DRAFT_1364923 [Mycena vulgaris]
MYHHHHARQRLPAPELVFPSPNNITPSLDDLSEYTLLEGSESFSFASLESDEGPIPSRTASPPVRPAPRVAPHRQAPPPFLAFLASLLALDPATIPLLLHVAADPPVDTQHGLFRLLRRRSPLHDVFHDPEPQYRMSSSLHYVPVVRAVERALAAHPVLRKLPAAKRRAFALDLALIALACRCAWLVDTDSDPDSHALFAAVHHLVLPDANSFFVNTTALPLDPDVDVAFVRLRPGAGEPQLLPRAPPDSPSSSALPARTLIPLAGVLLGYPVAYVPDGDADAVFLPHTPLDVYTLAVRDPAWPQAQEHTLLKFSCPAEVLGVEGVDPPASVEGAPAQTLAALASAQMLTALGARFGVRVRAVGLELRVTHAREVLERVAL